jgi:hypothetical protein
MIMKKLFMKHCIRLGLIALVLFAVTPITANNTLCKADSIIQEEQDSIEDNFKSDLRDLCLLRQLATRTYKDLGSSDEKADSLMKVYIVERRKFSIKYNLWSGTSREEIDKNTKEAMRLMISDDKKAKEKFVEKTRSENYRKIISQIKTLSLDDILANKQLSREERADIALTWSIIHLSTESQTR